MLVMLQMSETLCRALSSASTVPEVSEAAAAGCNLFQVHPASAWVARWCKDGSSAISPGGLVPRAMWNSTAICWASRTKTAIYFHCGGLDLDPATDGMPG